MAVTKVNQDQSMDVVGALTATTITGDIHASAGSIGTTELAADAVTAAKLADDAVVTANITALNVTTGTLALDAVTGAQIADDAVDTEHLADDAVVPAAVDETQNYVMADLQLTGTLTRPALAAVTLKMTDNDDAATTGSALYVEIEFGFYGSLNCDNSGSNESSVVVLSDDVVLQVADNASTPAGSQVFFDEANQVLTANTKADSTLYVTSATGRMLQIQQNDDPGNAGHLAVYFDDDATPPTDRMLFVSGLDTDSTAACSTTREAAAPRLVP